MAVTMLLGTLLLGAFSWLGTLKTLLMIIFFLVSVILMLVVLLQEPKGGGLAAAFGGAGAETFGVQTGGVNKFTTILACLFVGIAIAYAALPSGEDAAPSDVTRIPAVSDGDATPADGGTDGAADAEGGGVGGATDGGTGGSTDGDG